MHKYIERMHGQNAVHALYVFVYVYSMIEMPTGITVALFA
jgi:hypothetical protein